MAVAVGKAEYEANFMNAMAANMGGTVAGGAFGWGSDTEAAGKLGSGASCSR